MNNRRESETLKTFSLCLYLGHIPVSKVNSTVTNRRVSIFGDESVTTKDEIGMTKNVFYGFYTKFNLPPDVDPNSLSLSISGPHSVTISGTRYTLNVTKPERQPELSNKQEPAFLRNYNEQISHLGSGTLSNVSEHQATHLKRNPTKPAELPQDSYADFPPPPPELLYSSSHSTHPKMEAEPPSGPFKIQPLINYFEKKRKDRSSKSMKPESIPKQKARKYPKVTKRYRQPKSETHSVATQTESPQAIPMFSSRRVSENGQFNLKPSKGIHHGTWGKVPISSNDRHLGTQSPFKQDSKRSKSAYKDNLLESQVEDKQDVIKTNPHEYSQKDHSKEKQHIPISDPGVRGIVPAKQSQNRRGPSKPPPQILRDFSEISIQDEDDLLDINPRDKNHIPKSYLQGRQIPQEIPLDMWIKYLRNPD
ncbi:uncharacterized protein LOC119969413 [Scyliorhinus canicula]|uniref:uncharacterized protein LOC119969413 n=1 Tax=Scyliorhinus canicula TaxID=7830 RepID=UPI0018F4130A|nr:uncharacterized protein LOC119969413 [Scyliorhinus canicula]XP_038658963.1 uncharacterized protein LOC119969413 [Scyliorhinus canicula]